MMENQCPVWAEWVERFRRLALPHVRELAVHIQSCPECRNYFLANKDMDAFALLTASEEDFERVLEKLARGDSWENIE